jgi:hypothetical protein
MNPIQMAQTALRELKLIRELLEQLLESQRNQTKDPQ